MRTLTISESLARVATFLARFRQRPQLAKKAVETNVPEGMDFLRLVWKYEDELEATTDTALPHFGKKAPQCLERLGTVLSLLDRTASCFWGCAGGDHVLEYLAGRTASLARATLRLMRLAFYDEALVLVRGVGEIANLLTLFAAETTAFEQWRKADAKARFRLFRPSAVRNALEQKGIPPPMTKERYSRLCETVAHVTPNTKPQTYNPHGRPVAGGMFQEAGILVALNELSAFVAVATLVAAKLILKDPERRKEIKAAVLALIDSVGAVSVLNVQDSIGAARQTTEDRSGFAT
jgi:hypothetical protein